MRRSHALVTTVGLLIAGTLPAASADEVTVEPSTTWKASVPDGGLGVTNGSSSRPVLSANGRYVAFSSLATNLVPGDTNGPILPPVACQIYSNFPVCEDLGRDAVRGQDVFVRDRDARHTIRVSVASDGSQAQGVHWGSYEPVISWDGQRIAFTSDATGILDNDDTGGSPVVYVHDLGTRETFAASITDDGAPAWGSSPAISGNGRWVAYEGFLNEGIYLTDLANHTTALISVASNGTPANRSSLGPTLSRDGRYIAFASFADNLVPNDTNDEADIFVHDRLTGTTERVSINSNEQQADVGSQDASISGDGRIIAFNSWATNFNSADTNNSVDVYTRDRLTGTTQMISINTAGEQANGTTVLDLDGHRQAISANGRYIAMKSYASNLAPGTNGVTAEAYVHDRHTGETWLASRSSAGEPSHGLAGGVTISADGAHVAFSALPATGPGSITSDIFIRSRATGICITRADTCILDR